MPELPFPLPKSLISYVEQFDKNPEKTIGRFKKQLKRRGPDATGYLVLAWFYYRQNEEKKALDCALKAKNMAPGSPFFNKLPFYFSHPDLFDARYISVSGTDSTKTESASGTSLNSLIEKLSGMKTKRIEPDYESDATDNPAYDTKDVDGIVSETLAKIHEQQGNYRDAIRIYQILKRVKKERREFYDKRINELKELQAEEN